MTQAEVRAARVYRDARLWRAVDIYRSVTLIYAIALFVPRQAEYRHPRWAWGVLVVMSGWTVFLLVHRIVLRGRRTPRLLALDLALAVACVLSTMVVDEPARIAGGAAPLPSIWVASAVFSYAVAGGWVQGLLAALVLSTAGIVEVWPNVSSGTIDSIVQLILLGTVIGYTVELHAVGRRDLARAVAVEAAGRERERLAADIHDSVLQVLAYVQRRGIEVGGEAAEIGRLAGEQEARLRAMVASETVKPAPVGEADVKALLVGMGRQEVTVTGPAGQVLLPTERTLAVVSAVAAALDNVRRHARDGAKAWVFVEDEGGVVTVTVRDDGVGFDADRLVAAGREGRLGMSASIRGRIQEVGGRVDVLSTPGEGTEIELRVPRGTSR